MERQLKQADIAKIFDVHLSKVKFWETGRSMIRPELLCGVIEFLGYNPLLGEGETLGQKVKRFREENNVKRDALRKLVGINWDTLRRIEDDNPLVKIQNIEKMELYLTTRKPNYTT